jgi:hypothetical protein
MKYGRIIILLQLDSGRMYLSRIYIGRINFCCNWIQVYLIPTELQE